MKYKVGDKVKIREDLVVDMGRNGVRVTESMLKYAGKVVRIRKTYNLSGIYEIDADNKEYMWTDEMLEDVESESDVMMIKIYQDGNKVIAKKEGKFGVARCSPEDEFDIFVGAKLALERLEKQSKLYAWLKNGMGYYRPNINNDTMYTYTTFYNDENDKRLISRGLVFKTKEEAVAAAKKMLVVLKEVQNNERD